MLNAEVETTECSGEMDCQCTDCLHDQEVTEELFDNWDELESQDD